MTTQDIQKEIIKELRGYKDWLAKYQRLIQIGKTLPAIDDKFKTEDTLIKGCQVRTWYGSSFRNGKMHYRVDSMSLIVKGAVVLLLRVVNERTPEEIKDIDLFFIDKLGLGEIFSPSKANSLWKLTQQIKEDAAKYAAKGKK